MKMIRKLASIALALIMLFAMAAPAMAAQEGDLTGGSITISNAAPGQTYDAYQILYLESYNATSGAYSYKANSAWETWLRTQTTYVSFNDDGYVTWVTGASAADFAAAAQGQLSGKTADASVTAGAAASGSSTTTATFSDLKLGYYLVDTTLGSLCSLDTTSPSVTMEEKNEIPTISKQVQEDRTGDFGASNDAEINQTVTFRTTIDIKEIKQSLTMHDTMSAGLTFINVTSVTVGGTAVASDKYTVKTENMADTSCTFEIVFDQTYIASLTSGTQIVVEYTAKLNENAKIGLEGNTNTVKLEYGNNAYTTEAQTKTYTWDLDVLKYANGDESAVLAGAKFVLLNSDSSKVAVISNGKLARWEDVPTAAEGSTITWPDGAVLTTGTNGKIEIDGLDADTYYLREVKAPDGYNKLDEDISVPITGAETNAQGVLTYSTFTAKVNNQSGTKLPSTGGIGTTIFYIAGGVLVLAAVVLLVTRKRMSREG